MNKAIIIGSLGNDPELKTIGNTKVCNLSIATNEKYKDANGNTVDRTEWHRCVAFGKTGELIAKYFKKGDKISVEGKIKYDSYEKDGVKKQSTSIVVSEFYFIAGKTSSNSTATSQTDDLPF